MAETTYNSLVAELLADPPLNALGAGQPEPAKRSLLEQLSAESLVAPRVPRDRDAAAGCCAGLWLRYDFLEEAHRISQDIATTDGSYWHAIMHRREPDFSHAKQWFLRVGQHPVFSALVVEAAKLTKPHATDVAIAFLTNQDDWDPMRFVDLCESAIGRGGEIEMLCREIQRREWDLLFDFCYRKAAAV